jgi:N4-(beta-N-acetylglucosaminyl)-L-asparaginase
MGFKTQNLLTEQSRRDWMRWKAKLNPSDNWLDPVDPPPSPSASPAARRPAPAGVHVYRDASGVPYTYGTINMNAVTATGDIASVTTTSGLSWKIPGRVGDSPILGAGLYVDGEVGAAGSTGRGEANLYNLCSFLIVEAMRRGAHPRDAGMEALKRVVSNTVEKRLKNERGQPNFDLQFYVLARNGQYAGVSMYESHFAVCTEKGAATLPTESLYPGRP